MHTLQNGPAFFLLHLLNINSDHWRKNIPVLARAHRVYAIDLIGYGYSDKPDPKKLEVESFYTFETWGGQLNDFCTEIVEDEAFFICNSIGGDLLVICIEEYFFHVNISNYRVMS